MGFAVLHLSKASGSDSGMSSHIERKIDPKNADKKRTHLNKELIQFPDSVENRTQAIQYRIDHAGVGRKIGKNQVRAIRVLLTGSHEDMKKLQRNRKLNKWCNTNIEWLQHTFGSENLVSAVLHMDEKTPHIHATIVPIVTGERRKAKKQETANKSKKKYRKKAKDMVRLCADDVMARNKLKSYQDSYAEQMKAFGLQRGVDGSEARHISTSQFYKELFSEKEELKQEIEILHEKQAEEREVLLQMCSFADESKKAIEQNLYNYDEELKRKKQELEILKKQFEPYKIQAELNAVYKFIPQLKFQMPVALYCEQTGISHEYIGHLLKGSVLNAKIIQLHSPRHQCDFTAKDIRMKIEPKSDNTAQFHFTLNGQDIDEWFDQKAKLQRNSFQSNFRVNPNKKRGFGL